MSDEIAAGKQLAVAYFDAAEEYLAAACLINMDDMADTNHMNDKLTQQEVNDICWRACDTFRGVIDGGQYKDYILVMLFIKYISDVWRTIMMAIWRNIMATPNGLRGP